MKFKKGNKPWNTGMKMSDEHKKKLSDIKKKNPVRYWLGKERTSLRDEYSLKRQNKSEYTMVHKWISDNFGKAQKCESCGKKETAQWSNKDHKYKRDRKAWQQLCSKCHKNYDKEFLGVKA